MAQQGMTSVDIGEVTVQQLKNKGNQSGLPIGQFLGTKGNTIHL